MIGRAHQLRAGDVLVTEDGDRWPLRDVRHSADGIRIYPVETPFPWLYGRDELVSFLRGES